MWCNDAWMLANYYYYPQVLGLHRLDLQPQFLHQKENISRTFV